MAVFGLIRNWRHERAGFTLYAAAVRAARDPWFYAGLGVPDTLDGRFDMVGIHAFLLIRRLRRGGDRAARQVAQAVFDAMFSDMDVNLREIGVGDMSISRRVRAMWEAFHGRAAAYESAMQQDSDDALADAIARNVWRGGDGGDTGAPVQAQAHALARLMRAQDAELAAQPALAGGSVHFLDTQAALR